MDKTLFMEGLVVSIVYLLFRFLEMRIWDRMVLMFQRELGQRIVSKEGNKSFGRISVMCQVYFDKKVEFTVSKNVFQPKPDVDSAIVDPKNFKNNSFVSRKVDECVIPPNSFALASTIEYFKVPKDILVIYLGKSTYARCGIIVNLTPLELS